MVWKKQRRNVLLFVALVYTLVIFSFLNRTILKSYLPSRETENEEFGNNLMLKFDLRLSKNGIEETNFEDEDMNTKINFLTKRQKLKKNGGLVKSKEIIFIDKKEYQDGTIELDQTNIKQRLNRHKQLEIDTLRKMFNSTSDRVPGKRNTNEKKYFFVLRYYEQLAMATKNFLSLASLATATGRYAVEPFVNNSRFCGLPSGVSFSRFLEATKKFSKMDQYFDRKHLQYQMQSRGYTGLASFEEFKLDCSRLDIVIHFIYKDSNVERDLGRWYKIDSETIRKIRLKTSREGWTECNFVKRSRIDKFLGGKQVSRYVCVDPDMINTPEELEKLVLKNAKCAAIISWKGNGTKRTHFPLAPQISEQLKPVHIRHSKRLIDIAHDYIRNTIKRPFISVHVRVERHVKWKGLKAAKTCIQKLNNAIQQRKSRLNLKKIFLAHDLGENGSDTLQHFSDTKALKSLEGELLTSLGNPFRFNPKKYGLYDRGAIAIVEMHIMSLGESLFTLGTGNFQQWVIDLFLLQNAEDKSLVYRVCELERNNKK